MKPRRDRVDRLLVERGLAPSRARAQALIMAGKVVVGEQRVDKPGAMIACDAELRVRGDDNPYVSRGGLKLAGALRRFGAPADGRAPLLVEGRVAMDVGASTGGFTDCLLQAGVTRVHAVDVGYGQLAWALAQDPRVIVHDRRNIRRLAVEEIGEPVELLVMDCSFIAAAKVLPHLPRFLAASADAVVLVKPQFELDPGRVGKGGVVRREEDRAEALERARASAEAVGLRVVDACESEVEGRTGNREWLLWLRWEAGTTEPRGPEGEDADASRG
ncbi:TlyA family RNA methyltransferase [Paraliomyxa miuraensis]|uniref:TlyA family RNA methyltransferase n=1 Tax=Paraliomyxa miuraensis TaxID=376150 RepID=UPI00225B058A|nr:TlyA family RNA methyltransferase [Paraliomyxa miuraensis]MCX4246159.1 TlyA family RNA methyltransferase [Paraliomyxa miuraensis]